MILHVPEVLNGPAAQISSTTVAVVSRSHAWWHLSTPPVFSLFFCMLAAQLPFDTVPLAPLYPVPALRQILTHDI